MDTGGFGQRLDLVTLEVFFNLNDSVILYYIDKCVCVYIYIYMLNIHIRHVLMISHSFKQQMMSRVFLLSRISVFGITQPNCFNCIFLWHALKAPVNRFIIRIREL